ncbi:MAG: RnfABCDGE type electron transport complex subunit D [Ruminococcaceae bacterium]|nr:RnfABCDGE type electron transport complex subunit D [Oscillospiraceae bacterium]
MKKTSPEKLKSENSAVRSYMIDMIIMLLVISVVSIYTYGLRAAESIILSVLAAVAVEVISYTVFLRKNPERISDLSAVFTGLVIALALPSSAPLWLAPLGSVFAIAIAKIPFGNAITVPFVPAAVGLSFLTISYPEYVFTYPSLSIGSLSTAVTEPGFVAGTSLANMLSQSKSIGTNILNILDVFVGRVPGPIGASCFILMLGTLVYMIIRRQPGVITTVSFLAACSFMAVLFPRILTGRTYSLFMELSAGLLFFAAVFFVSDPATSPKSQIGKVLYGLTAGVITMLLRYFGTFEEGVCFAVLVVNALSAQFDDLGAKVMSKFQMNPPKKTLNRNVKMKKIRKTRKARKTIKSIKEIEVVGTIKSEGIVGTPSIEEGGVLVNEIVTE